MSSLAPECGIWRKCSMTGIACWGPIRAAWFSSWWQRDSANLIQVGGNPRSFGIAHPISRNGASVPNSRLSGFGKKPHTQRARGSGNPVSGSVEYQIRALSILSYSQARTCSVRGFYTYAQERSRSSCGSNWLRPQQSCCKRIERSR